MARELYIVMVEGKEAGDEPEVIYVAGTLAEAEEELQNYMSDLHEDMIFFGAGENFPKLKDLCAPTYFIQKFISKGRHSNETKLPDVVKIEGTMDTCRFCFKKAVSQDSWDDHNYLILNEWQSPNEGLVTCNECWKGMKYTR